MRILRRLASMSLPAVLVALAVAHVGLFLYLVARRAAFPYDLEWMESGMLLHALRLAQGKVIYGPPTLDFVPYLYTPLYPALLALLSKLVPLGYLLGRLVSLASLVGALVLGFLAARRAGCDRVTAFGAMAAVLAAFPFVGAWYDLARNDELCLLLCTGALFVAIRWRSVRGAVLAGLLVCLAYFTKQTALAFVVATAVVIGLLRARHLVAFALVVALGVVAAFAVDRWTGGWFFNWVYRGHARHLFFAERAFVYTPLQLFKQAPAIWVAGVALLLVGAWRRRLRREHLAWALAAGAGVGAACLGFGTQWAFANAFIPGVFLVLVGVAALAGTQALPLALVHAALIVQLATHVYDPRPYCPKASDRIAGDRLIARLAAVPGDVLVPFHPYYGVLAGKRPYVHRMGVLDAPSSGFGRPRGLDQAIARQHFALIVMDYKLDWNEWPTLRQAYETTATLRIGVDAPRTFSGADTAPLYVMEPRAKAPGTP